MKEYNESEIRNHYHELTNLLIERGLTITTMESATSGQLASLITDTEGSSAVLKGAFVTYCNEAKIQQGVPAEILERYTVYSRETAEAMAKTCRKAYGADIGIGVTGTMGNVDPANPEASVPGQVYFAIATRSVRKEETVSGGPAVNSPAANSPAVNSPAVNSPAVSSPTANAPASDILTTSYYVELAPQPTRLMYKLAVAEEIYQVLMGILAAHSGAQKQNSFLR